MWQIRAEQQVRKHNRELGLGHSSGVRKSFPNNAAGTATSVVRYAWNGYLPWAELNATNGVVRTFTWGVDMSGAVGGAGGIGGLVGIRHGGTNYLVRSEGRGNVAEVRLASGAVVAAYSYAPYGELLADTGTYKQPFRFQTKLFHARSGYTAWPFRWYDPLAGRWISRDPAGEAGSVNLYLYTHQNPVSLHDPRSDIVPALLVIWAGIEFGLSVYDAYTTVDTLLDPCASSGERWAAAGGFLAGSALQGGGYSKLGKEGVRAGRKLAPVTGEIVEHGSQRAARRAAQRQSGMGTHGGREVLPDQPLRPGSQSPSTGPRGTRTEVKSTDTGAVVHHDPYGTRYNDGTVTPPHYGVENPSGRVTHHTYPSDHDPRTNR